MGAPGGKLITVDQHRIFVPRGARKQILSVIHNSHLRTANPYLLIKMRYLWHSMKEQVRKLSQSCEACRKIYLSKADKAEVIEDLPSFPMQKMSVDPFH